MGSSPIGHTKDGNPFDLVEYVAHRNPVRNPGQNGRVAKLVRHQTFNLGISRVQVSPRSPVGKAEPRKNCCSVLFDSSPRDKE